MPFTPSHVAAVLPFSRSRLLPAGLVIGAMAPDLFYYVPIDVSRSLAHSWLGIVTVDLAFGVLVFLLWQLVFRAPVLDFAPLWVRARMGHSEWMPVGRLRWLRLGAVLAASLVLGSLTHVIWDSFTHVEDTVFTVPALLVTVGPLPLHKWLQHLSSAVGIAAVILFVIAWKRRITPKSPAPTQLSTGMRVGGWVVVGSLGLGAALVQWIHGTITVASPVYNALIFRTVTLGIAVAGLAAVLLSLAWQARRSI